MVSAVEKLPVLTCPQIAGFRLSTEDGGENECEYLLWRLRPLDDDGNRGSGSPCVRT